MIHLYLRKMIDHAFAFASKSSLVRVSEIHGEEEAKLILDDSFGLEEEENETAQSRQRMTVQVS